jgi:hypothetical protein
MGRLIASGAIALAMLLGGAGCGAVRPWQRETLSHRCMTEDGRPEESRARQHMLSAREAAQGASGETGGGCGCN